MVPLTVSMKAPLPALTDVGLIDEIVGTGLFGLTSVIVPAVNETGKDCPVSVDNSWGVGVIPKPTDVEFPDPLVVAINVRLRI